MIPYNQTNAKITNTESFRLKSCIRRTADSIDKRFCFDIIPEDRSVYPIEPGKGGGAEFGVDFKCVYL